MAIRKLDTYTIEQIAAGEVIESPVSIVKELFENSIDAGAHNITVEIKNGGKSYIRVTDDGHGISPEDMTLAFEKHATSKIVKFDDLYDIYSLGFRGEALASIVSVSDVKAISKTADNDIGSKIEFRGPSPKVGKIATNTGTSIEVFDLFKNLPARYKFLKSDIAETNSISRLMYSLAIGYQNVSIKYIKDDKVEFKTNLNDPLELRISKLLDDNLSDNLINLEASNDIYKVTGFVSSPNYYRGSRAFEYVFVNNRLIDSSNIVDTIEREYRSYIPNARFPAIFLFIETNPKNLDVNVHPNKRVIKFNYEQDLLELLTKTIHELLAKNTNPQTIIYKDESKDTIADFSDYGSLLDKYSKFNVINTVKEDTNSYEEDDFFDDSKAIDSPVKAKKEVISTNDTKDYNETFLKEAKTYNYLTSFFGRYSLFEITKETLLILDHRRADEAIKYNHFRSEIDKNSVNSQMLLSPIVINLKANDKIKFEQKKDYITSLGLDIGYFGENQIIIRSIPQIFDVPESNEFFYDLLDLNFDNPNDIFYKNLYKFVKSHSFRKGHSINCKEADYLMGEVFKLKNPYKTYDGKAIMVEISAGELEKYFD